MPASFPQEIPADQERMAELTFDASFRLCAVQGEFFLTVFLQQNPDCTLWASPGMTGCLFCSFAVFPEKKRILRKHIQNSARRFFEQSSAL
ncbi:MAG: hypothetical protein ACI399_07580 [Candidatus Cryptobacteroides sp.]